jgi:6-phosphogluconolactonase (cycloisomerase 2 family)
MRRGGGREDKIALMSSRLLVLVLLALAFAVVPASTALAADDTRPVLWVGNNWDGTADAIDPTSFQKLAHLNIVPDKEERLAEIMIDPARQGYFFAIRELVGEGHDQFVDDMFTSHDGRFLYVSRPSLADVAAFDLSDGKIVWRTRVDGYRADHMAISPDGKRLLVSASTAKVVDVIDTADGKIVTTFPSGDQPHENNYSRDGKLIYHASIGTVYSPADEPAMDAAKGERVFEIVDASTYKVLRRLDMGKKLAEAGYKDMSSAVRPMALSPDERYLYFQVSFFHGFVEYDLKADKVLRLANLPQSEKAKATPREQYLLDSAHHGLAMNPEGTKLCAAGTMSDYIAIVHRDDFKYRIASEGEKPYWATNSGDGRLCFVSFSGIDSIAAIDYSSEREVARVQVGDHPQRMRMGVVRVGSLGIPAAVAPECVDRRKFTFRLRGKRRATKVEVFVDGVRKVRRRGRNIRSVTLAKLPKGRFVVKVVTTYANGSKRESTRTYRGCKKSKPHTRRG